jgi:orotidine-5'-phosphate decarboxylase
VTGINDLQKARESLIFALDVPLKEEAMELVRRLRGEVGLFKVGLELYLAQGPALLKDIIKEVEFGEARIFLDLKLYDIPHTVVMAAIGIEMFPAFLTIPSDLGRSAIERIRILATTHRLLAVTVLTSMTPQDLKDLGYEPQYAADPSRLVVSRARMAQAAGCAGVVCSGQEVKAVKQACGPDFLAVCPGIRPDWALVPGDDQQRTVTPYQAIKDGADYIVVGRPIRTYPESDGGPVAAARRVVAEIEAALGD